MELEVTDAGEITLPQQALAHLGVKPGDEIEVRRLSGGRIALVATSARATSTGPGNTTNVDVEE